MRRHMRTGLWGQSDFVKLWLGRTVSQFGSHITYMALAVTAILWLKATPFQMGLLAATGDAAVLLFGLLAGVWIDRLRRRPILIATDLVRALALVSIPVAAIGGWLSLAQLYLVGALTGVQSVFFDVADRAYLPTLVEREQLLEANAKLSASEAVAEVGGQALAGILVQWLSAPIAIVLDALSYVFSAACLGLIRKPEPPPIATHARESAGQAVVTGLRLVLKDPILRALTASAAFREFFGNFWQALYFLFLVRALGLSPAFVGISIAVGGVGSLLGTLLVGPITRRFGIGQILIGTLLLQIPLGWIIPLAHGPRVTVMALCLVAQFTDLLYPIQTVTQQSLRQALIPHRLMGRATASMDFLTRGVGPLGALLGGALGSGIGMRATLMGASLGTVLAMLCLLFSPVRRLKTLPERSEEAFLAR